MSNKGSFTAFNKVDKLGSENSETKSPNLTASLLLGNALNSYNQMQHMGYMCEQNFKITNNNYFPTLPDCL